MSKRFRTLFFPFLFSVLIYSANAQENPDIQPPANIRSIVLSPNEANAYTPVIRLGESFSLSFDDLDADQKFYTYKIEH
jgi:hypothetical protein